MPSDYPALSQPLNVKIHECLFGRDLRNAFAVSKAVQGYKKGLQEHWKIVFGATKNSQQARRQQLMLLADFACMPKLLPQADLETWLTILSEYLQRDEVSIEAAVLALTCQIQILIQLNKRNLIVPAVHHLFRFGVMCPDLLVMQLNNIARQFQKPLPLFQERLVHQLQHKSNEFSEEWALIGAQSEPIFAAQAVDILVPEDWACFRSLAEIAIKAFASQMPHERLVVKIEQALKLLESKQHNSGPPEELFFAPHRAHACDLLTFLVPHLDKSAATPYLSRALLLMEDSEIPSLTRCATSLSKQAAVEYMNTNFPLLQQEGRVDSAAYVLSTMAYWLTPDLVTTYWDLIERFFATKDVLFAQLDLALAIARNLSTPRQALTLWNAMFTYLSKDSMGEKTQYSNHLAEILQVLIAKVERAALDAVFEQLVSLTTAISAPDPERPVSPIHNTVEVIKPALRTVVVRQPQVASKRFDYFRVKWGEYVSDYCELSQCFAPFLEGDQVTLLWSQIEGVYLADSLAHSDVVSTQVRASAYATLSALLPHRKAQSEALCRDIVATYLKSLGIADTKQRRKEREKSLRKLYVVAPVIFPTQAAAVFDSMISSLVSLPRLIEVLIACAPRLDPKLVPVYLNKMLQLEGSNNCLYMVIAALLKCLSGDQQMCIWEYAPRLFRINDSCVREQTMRLMVKTIHQLSADYNFTAVDGTLEAFAVLPANFKTLMEEAVNSFELKQDEEAKRVVGPADSHNAPPAPAAAAAAAVVSPPRFA